MQLENFNEVLLKDLLVEKGYIRGPFGSSLKRDEMKTEGIAVYEQFNAIYNSRKFRYFIDNEKFSSLKRFQVKSGDLIISCSGTVGKVSIIKDSDPKGIISQALLILRVNEEKVLPEFLKYFFESPQGYRALVSNASGSVQKNIAERYVIENIPILLPDLNIQHNIVKTLMLYDKKIKLNNISNNLIRRLIKIIFSYWFLQFDFPNEANKPYKSSGGEMVYNEELKREIPKGWTVGNLDDIAQYINGLPCQKYRPISEDDKLPVIKITEMHDGFTDRTEFVRSDIDKEYIVEDGDILFSWSATLETMIWVGGKGGLNQHIFKVIPKDYGKYYVYQQLSSYIINFVRMAQSRKTTMGHITKDHLSQSKIPLPPKELTYKFNDLVSDFYDKFVLNNQENRELNNLKDFLLPLLLSGQVSFKD